MAQTITMQKRTRTLTNEVYSDWSDWAETTDTSPFVDTDLIEYKLSTDVKTDFEDKYGDNFSNILALTIADGTPYKATIAFLTEQFNDYNITDEYKAQLTAQLMSNMTVGFTQSAMQTAITLTDKEVMADVNLDNATKQGVILGKQATKLDADTSMVTAQESAITQQVIDNRKIKMTTSMGETYSNMAMGSMTVSSDMWQVYFDKLDELDSITAVTDFTITKVS